MICQPRGQNLPQDRRSQYHRDQTLPSVHDTLSEEKSSNPQFSDPKQARVVWRVKVSPARRRKPHCPAWAAWLQRVAEFSHDRSGVTLLLLPLTACPWSPPAAAN